MRNKIRINHPPAPALKRRGSNSKPLLFKEGLGWLILGCCTILFFSIAAIGNNGTNYWADTTETSSAPFIAYTPTASPDPKIKNITLRSISLQAGHTGCYDGGTPFWDGAGLLSKHKGTAPHSINMDTGITRCQNLALAAQALAQKGKGQAAYDAYRAYIDTCAYLSNSWETFGDVGGQNGVRSSDLHRFEEYRDWLKKVLYFNLDTNFYCADVNQILRTFGWFNDQRGKDYKGNLAVMYFLVQTKRCGWKYMDTINIPATWKALYSAWQDSVTNPNLTPFDSTLPSIDSLGLGILRGPPAEVKKFIDATSGPIISNIHALENPFTSETKIDFTLRETAAIKMEIFDVLGKKYYGTEKVFDGGDNQIILPGSGLPHGVLYARFTASDGTVKTISLRHIE